MREEKVVKIHMTTFFFYAPKRCFLRVENMKKCWNHAEIVYFAQNMGSLNVEKVEIHQMTCAEIVICYNDFR